MMTGCERIALEARFLKFTKRLPCGCLVWTGAQSSGGNRKNGKHRNTGGPYGRFYINKALNSKAAHVVWAWLQGIIPTLRVPEGHHIDHGCKSGTLCLSCIGLLSDKENLKLRHTRNHADDARIVALDVARDRRDRVLRERRRRASTRRKRCAGNPQRASR